MAVDVVHPYVEGSLDRDELESMVRACGNHPSVVMWGIFNENARAAEAAGVPGTPFFQAGRIYVHVPWWTIIRNQINVDVTLTDFAYSIDDEIFLPKVGLIKEFGEDHTVGFRQGPLFPQWRAIVGPFFAQPPVVESTPPLARRFHHGPSGAQAFSIAEAASGVLHSVSP